MTGDHAGEDLMTRRQVAFLFRVTSQAVAAWVRRGRLAEVRNAAGKPRYRRAEVEELFRSVFRGESPGTGPGPADEPGRRPDDRPPEPTGDMARDGVFKSDEELGQFLAYVCAAQARPHPGVLRKCTARCTFIRFGTDLGSARGERKAKQSGLPLMSHGTEVQEVSAVFCV